MPASVAIEERVATLEAELGQLRAQVQSLAGNKENWIDKITGTFEDVPEFDEVLRLVREMREAELAEFDRNQQ